MLRCVDVPDGHRSNVLVSWAKVKNDRIYARTLAMLLGIGVPARRVDA